MSFLSIITLGLLTTVPTGFVGVKTNFGRVIDQIPPGIHAKAPLGITQVNLMETRVQKEQVTASAASRDLQQVTSVVALNFRLDESKAMYVYQKVGNEYQVRIIAPAIQESVKATTAKFTAEELITKRQQVGEEIKTSLANRLSDEGLVIEDLNIVDFDFSKSFNEAIEAKVTAEQNALAAKNKLEQIKFEADQAIAVARGKAEAQKVEGEALRANPEVLQLRAVEKWNGVLPGTMVPGGSLPFIGVR